jgi:hypothetical protein
MDLDWDWEDFDWLPQITMRAVGVLMLVGLAPLVAAVRVAGWLDEDDCRLDDSD